jgi:hypothetical protein
MRIPKVLAASAVFSLLFLPPRVAAAGPIAPEAHGGRVFRVLAQNWCVGDVDPYVGCDVRIGSRSRLEIVHTSEKLPRPSFHDALDRLRLLGRPEPLTPLDKELRLHELLGGGAGAGGTGTMGR